MNLPEDILELNDAFDKEGKKIYLVGGAVRDNILGITPNDYDFATNASPKEAILITKKFSYGNNSSNLFSIGDNSSSKYHGVVKIKNYIISTFGTDYYKSVRIKDKNFNTIYDDIKIRDFTINSIYYDITNNQIIDLVDGVSDLKNRMVVTIGDATERFSQDQIRKLRAVRLAAKINGSLHQDIINSINFDSSISEIIKPRIKNEFSSGVKYSNNVVDYLKLLNSFSLIDKMFYNLNIDKNFINEKDEILLLAFMLKDNELYYVEETLKTLQYKLPIIEKIKFLILFYKDKVKDVHMLKEINKINDEQFDKFCIYINKNIL